MRVRKTSLTLPEKLRLRLKDLEFRSPTLATNRQLVRLVVSGDPFLQSLQGSDGKEIIFIHVPKTAGTSIATMLGRKALHIPLSRYYTWNRDRAGAAWKFAVVRDPAERLHSAYNYLYFSIGANESLDVRWSTEVLSRIKSFEDFLDLMFDASFKTRIMRWTHFRPQLHWMRPEPKQEIAIDRVLRFEALDKGIEELSQQLGQTLTLPHLRMPRRERLTKPLSDRHHELIRRLYWEDYEAFGYGH